MEKQNKQPLSKHERILQTVNEVMSNGPRLGIAQLSTEDLELNGRHVNIHGRELMHFGSCSYLGLELDQRLREGAMDAIDRYGVQFSSSRAFLSLGLYEEAEAMLQQIFGHPAILTASTTLGHFSSIPVIVGDNDVVILDHQVHASVQTAVQTLASRRVKVDVVRHNNLVALEEKIEKYSKEFTRVWYMVDGVYSMYGDYAPLKEIQALQAKYEKLHLYIDDAHAMSWCGQNGSGFALSQIELNERTYMSTSANKGFASGGGILVFPEEEKKRLVRNCGGTMIFSGPLQPPMLGAAIASAKIHLSGEIYVRQDELRKRIDHFNSYANRLGLPLVSESTTPIFFIGVGKPQVGYNMAQRLMDHGCFVNVSAFPSVPYKNTGLRLCANLHQSFEDIELVLDAIAEELPQAIREENSSMDEIFSAFKMEPKVGIPQNS